MQQPISVEYGLNNDNDIHPNLSSNDSQTGANNLLYNTDSVWTMNVKYYVI